MTFLEIQTAVSLGFHDRDFKRFGSGTLTLYKQFINEGVIYLAERVPSSYLKNLVVIPSGASFVNAGDTINLSAVYTDFLRLLYFEINGIPVLTGGEEMRRAHAFNAFLQDTTDFYTAYFRGRVLKVLPAYAVGDTFKCEYVKLPTEMVNDGDSPDVSSEVHYMIRDYTIGKLYSWDGDDERRTTIMGALDKEIKELLTLDGKLK